MPTDVAPTGDRLDGTAQATLRLPWSWEAWVRVSRAELAPVQSAFCWPAEGHPVVEVRTRRVSELPRPGATDLPDLLIAEIDDEDGLLALAGVARGRAFAALLFVAPGIRPEVTSEAQALAPELALVPLPPPGEPAGAAAGRSLDELVRRRVYRLLVAHWRRQLAAYELELSLLGVRSPTPLARPSMAPLSTIEHAHVAGVLGLGWPGEAKGWRALGVSRPAVARTRSRLPEALRAALGDPLAASGRDLSLLVVEDDPTLGEATRRLLVTLGEKRLGRGLRATVVTSAEAARRRMLDEGAPDLAWVDMQLETPRAGIELVRWMRTRAASSVVMGKTARAPAEDIRDLTRLGAVSVWTSSRPRELNALLVDAVRIADEASTIAGLEARTAQDELRLWPAVSRGLDAAQAASRVEHTRQLVELLEVDLHGPMPASLGDPGASLREVQAEAARLALQTAGGNVTQAARTLGIGWRAMRRYASRAKPRRS